MGGCETLLLLNLHRAVRFHYESGQHLDCYLGQAIFNSVLMALRCHPAPRGTFSTLLRTPALARWKSAPVHSANGHWSTAICCMLCTGCGGVAKTLAWPLFPRTLPSSKGDDVCVKNSVKTRWNRRCRGGDGGSRGVLRRGWRQEAQWVFWEDVTSAQFWRVWTGGYSGGNNLCFSWDFCDFKG